MSLAGDPGQAAAFDDVLRAALTSQPCHMLQSTVSYAYPSYTLLGRAPNPSTFLVHGIRMDKGLPTGTQSIELQSYNPGDKLLIKPVVAPGDGSLPPVEAWVVYRVSKKYQLLRHYDSTGYDVTDSNVLKDVLYADSKLKNTRKAEEAWVLAAARSGGQQSPYIETKSFRIAGTPGVIPSNYTYTDAYVEESCDPTYVVTPAQIATVVVPELVKAGYAQCQSGGSSASPPFSSVFDDPDCLATYLLSVQRNADLWTSFKAQAGIIPLLGTTFLLQDCINAGGSACWGELAVSAVTDAATIFVPVLKSGATVVRAKTTAKLLSAAERPLLGMAAVGQAGLGAKNLKDGDVLNAMAHFVGAGAMVYQIKSMAVKDPVTQASADLTTLRKLDGETPDAAPSCAPLKKPDAAESACSLDPVAVGSCRVCIDVDDALKIPASLRMDKRAAAIYTDIYTGTSEAADLLKSSPGSVVDKLFDIAVPFDNPTVKIPPNAKIIRAAQWRNLTIVEVENTASFISEAQLEQWGHSAWAAEMQQIPIPVAGYRPISRWDYTRVVVTEQMYRTYDLSPNYFDPKSRVAYFERPSIKMRDGSTRSITDKIFDDNKVVIAIRDEVAQAAIEEVSHGQSFAQLSDIGLPYSNRQHFLPLSQTTFKFKCWVESLSDFELKMQWPKGLTLNAQDIRSQIAKQMPEADVANFLYDRGSPMNAVAMEYNYKIRSLLVKYYAQEMSTSYYVPKP